MARKCERCEGYGWKWREVTCDVPLGECEHMQHWYIGPECRWCLGSGASNGFTALWELLKRWVKWCFGV